MKTIIFDVKLPHEDYDSHLKGWRCSALRIPGAKVESIYNFGGQIPPSNYSVDYPAETIHFEHWKSPPTEDATVRLGLVRPLSTTRRAAWIGFFGTILGALVGSVSTFLLSPPARNGHCACDDAPPEPTSTTTTTLSDTSTSSSSGTETDTSSSTATDTTTRSTSRTRTASPPPSETVVDDRPSPNSLPPKTKERLANGVAAKPPSGNKVRDPAKTPRPTP